MTAYSLCDCVNYIHAYGNEDFRLDKAAHAVKTLCFISFALKSMLANIW